MRKLKQLTPILSSILIIGIFIVSDILLHSCAQIKMPTGGDKDTIAPVIVRCVPDSFSTNFEAQKIIIETDEFINLKNIQQELVVSPPLAEKPEILIKGKGFVIKLNNELYDSTTYTLSFGDAIQDITENNPIKDFQYVFSTGSTLDSLRIYGKLLDAFTHAPIENTWIMIYQNYNDSTPIDTIPDYIDKTDAQGRFSINNIRGGDYRIFALGDINSNFKFDLPNEGIAFDTLWYTPFAEYINVSDTIKIPNDSTKTDSLVTRQAISYLPDSITMLFFSEKHVKYFLTGNERTDRHKLSWMFSDESETAAFITPVNFEVDSNWFVPEFSPKNDTITYWLTDSVNYNNDTLKLSVSYFKPDSLGVAYLHSDTIMMKYTEKKEKEKKETGKKNKRKSKEVKEEKKNENLIELKHNTNVSSFDLGQQIHFETNYPIANINVDSIKFTEQLTDTTTTDVKFSIQRDSLSPRKFMILFDLKQETKYNLFMDSTILTDIYGNYNDTVKTQFTTLAPEDYGKLVFEITGCEHPLIIQMISGEDIKREVYLDKAQKLEFNYVKEGDYIFRAIIDENGNKEWDTGNYLQNKQPEKLVYFEETVKVIKNAENIIEWNM